MVYDKFPVEVFPEKLQHIIKEMDEKLNFAPDFVGLSMLYAISVAVGNTTHIERKKGYTLNGAVWFVFVARSGMGKTPPQKMILKPIFKREEKLALEYRRDLEIYNQQLDLSKKQLEEFGLEPPVKPLRTQHILKEWTPEVLVERLSENPRGIGVFSAELKEQFDNITRYAKNGAKYMLLTFFDGDSHNSDTLNKSKFISKPFLPMMGGMTPNIFDYYYNQNREAGDGTWERFCVSKPEGLERKTIDEEIDESLLDEWEAIVNRALDIPLNTDEFGTPIPRIAKFTKSAKLRLYEWDKVNDLLINEECEENATIHSKIEQYVIKFALLFHVLYELCGESKEEYLQVGNYSVENSIKLAKYFLNTHLKLKGKSVDDKLRNILETDQKLEWYEELPNVFGTREACESYELISGENSDRSVKRWLKNKRLFNKRKHGEYEKIYKSNLNPYSLSSLSSLSPAQNEDNEDNEVYFLKSS